MKINKLRSALVAAGLGLTATSGSALAAVTYFSPLTGFEDDNVEQFIDTNGNGVLDTGDRLRGVLEINQTFGIFGGGPAGFGDQELTGIFDVTVTNTVASASPGLFNYTFGPTAGFGFGAGAMVALFLDSTDDPASGLSVIGATNCANTADCEARATDSDTGLPYLVVGFSGLDGDEDWTAVDAEDNIGVVAGAPVSSEFGEVNFTLSILTNNSGQAFGLQSCPLPQCDDDQLIQLIGSGSVLGGQGLTNGYISHSDFQFQVAPVPEPATVALLALGLLGIGATLRRRNV